MCSPQAALVVLLMRAVLLWILVLTGSLLGNPIDHVAFVIGPKITIVDKGYQGVDVPDTQILRSDQQRGTTKTLRKMIKR